MADVVHGGRLAARAFAAEGVDTVFTVSTRDVRPIADGCRREGIRVLEVRRAADAAHAARAWARASRAAGIAIVDAPRATQAVPAVVGGKAEYAPLVLVGIADGADDQRISVLRPISKWAGACSSVERIPPDVATAFRHAHAQPRGPVYLEVAADALAAEGSAQVGRSRSTARTFGDPREVMKSADLLTRAERPAVLAGAAIWWDGAWKQLRAFAENGRLPVFLEGAARGSLAPEHELLFAHAPAAAFDAADVVCVIGTCADLPLRHDMRLVHVHADATQLGRNRAPDASIVGDAAAVLGILADGVKPNAQRDAWLEHLRAAEQAWSDEHCVELDSDTASLHPYGLGRILNDALPSRAVVVADGGSVVDAVARMLRVRRPGQWLETSPSGTGAAYALGVQAAWPDRPVVVITDRGPDAADVEALAQLGSAASFVVLAPGKGGAGEQAAGRAGALERALSSGEPGIVEIPVYGR